MQQIYKTPMPKSDFYEVAKHGVKKIDVPAEKWFSY